MPDPKSTYGEMFSEEGIQTVFNSSSLSAWDKCPTYYNYTVRRNLRHRNSSNVHFDFGGHFATAMELYKTLREKQSLSHPDAVRETIRETIAASVGMAETQTKNRHSLIRSLVWYFETYRYDLPIEWVGETPGVEVVVSVPITEKFSLVGAFDRLIRYQDELYIMDQKTTGSPLNRQFYENYRLSNQMHQYFFLGQAAFKTKVRGVMIDAISVSANKTEFGRYPITYTDETIEEWLKETLDKISAISSATMLQKFPHNRSSCSHYGGCMFNQICSASPSTREMILNADFTNEPVE